MRALATQEPGKSIQWPAVAIAAFSFVLWIYAIGGNFLNYPLPPTAQFLPSVVIGIWTFVLPYVYKGD